MAGESIHLKNQMKIYGIRQKQICDITGLTTCKVSRYFAGVRSKNPEDRKLIAYTANALIREAQARVAKMGQRND
jgi:transcriptional regulator with XRE-family HTH domain